MKPRTVCRRGLCVLAGCAVVALTAHLVLTDEPYHLQIATGPQGGTYLELGQQFAAILEDTGDHTIGRVEAMETNGSVTNIRSLVEGTNDLALAMKPALYDVSVQDDLREISVLTHLYTDFLHVLVRSTDSPETLAGFIKDARGPEKNVMTGPLGSGTRVVARAVLEGLGLSTDDYHELPCDDFNQVVEGLAQGHVDVGFIVAGTRSMRVAEAMKSGEVRLVDLSESLEQLEGIEGLTLGKEIPRGRYEHQPEAVRTVGADVLLLCRKDLPARVGERVLRCLADRLGDLLLPHTSEDDVDFVSRLLETEDERPGPGAGVAPHRGTTRFRKWREEEALWILTGTLNGRYYRLGKTIQGLLNPYKLETLVVPTEGSVENVRLLSRYRERGKMLAVMQYDVALAAQPGVASASVYGTTVEQIETLEGPELRSIAVLHQEKVHVLTRQAMLGRMFPERVDREPLTLGQLLEQGARVCLGPEDGGASPLASAILQLHAADPVAAEHLSVNRMVDALEKSGRGTTDETRRDVVDVAFFVSDVPSTLLEAVLNDRQSRLLPLDSMAVARLARGPAFRPSSITPGMYACLTQDEQPVQTVATDAVLVTTPDSHADIFTVTKAVFDGEGYLGIPDGKSSMARELASLPLHPQSRAFYHKARLLPAERTLADRLFEWLSNTWRTLTIGVILLGALVALLGLKRDRTSNGIGRQILAISVEASERSSVRKLTEIQKALPHLVQRRWWSPWEELDKPRWGYLNSLIEHRIKTAQVNLTRQTARDIDRVAHNDRLDAAERASRLRTLDRRTRADFENGELDASQLQMLLGLVRDAGATNRGQARRKGRQTGHSSGA